MKKISSTTTSRRSSSFALTTTILLLLASCSDSTDNTQVQTNNGTLTPPNNTADNFTNDDNTVSGSTESGDSAISLQPDRKPVFINSHVLVSSTVTNARGSAIQDPSTFTVDYDKQVIESRTPCCVYSYNYNESGHPVRRVLTTQDPGRQYTSEYNYNTDGLLLRISQTTVDLGGRGETHQTNIEYSYTANGDIAKRLSTVTPTSGNEEPMITDSSFEYASPGIISSVVTKGNAVDFTVTSSYTYNMQSQLSRIDIDRDNDGGIDVYHTFDYDESGNLTEQVVYLADGTLRSTYQYLYEQSEFPVFNLPLFDLHYSPYY